jgi:Tfp pilus assembly protein PilX
MKGRTLSGERGAILVVALVFVCVLAIAGSMAYRMTSTELGIAKNFASSKEALYSANAGLEEARAALGLPSTDPPGDSTSTPPYGNAIYDPATETSSPPYPDPNWTAYILAADSWGVSDDSDYSSYDTNYIPNSSSQTNTAITTNSLQTDLEYWVKIRHKTEYDAEQQGHDSTAAIILYDDYDGTLTGGHTPTSTNRGSVIVYGYAHKDDLDPTEDPEMALTARLLAPSAQTRSYRPVDIITAHGIGENSETTIRTEVAHDPGPPILAALYAEATSYSGVEGDAVHYKIDISGEDHCTATKCPFCGNVDIDDIYVYPADADPLLDDEDYNPTPPGPLSGSLPTIVAGDLNINVNQGITELQEWQESANYNDCLGNTDYNICSSTNDLTITDQDGTGVLLVQGNLTLEGGSVVETTWKGLILVTGELTLNGGGGATNGGIRIEGAVLVNGEVWINAANEGPVTIHYDSCAIDAALNSIPLKILKWEDLSITE